MIASIYARRIGRVLLMIARLVTTASLVLVLVSQAEAERAWVLWSSQVTISALKPRPDGLMDIEFEPLSDCSPVRAFASPGECDQVQKWHFGKRPRPRVGMEITDYRCLPDTVDPRGPKGGSR